MADPPQASSVPVPAPVAEIAARLAETDPEAIFMIGRLAETLGIDFARLVLRETLEVEARGGRRIMSKARRRTPGGVFFELVARRVARWRRVVFAHQARRGIQVHGQTASQPTNSPGFDWSSRFSIYFEASRQKGQASVKMTVTGRPSNVVSRDTFVVAVLEGTNPPSLPKGLPVPPASPTTFTVFMSRRHWAKVESAVKNPEDVLIVEGFPTLDAEAKTICVFATNTTTKLLQRAAKASKAGAGSQTQ